MDEIRYDERVSLVIPGGSPRQMTLAEAVEEALKAPPASAVSCIILREGNKPAIDGLHRIRAIRERSEFPNVSSSHNSMHLRSLYESSNGDRCFLGRRDDEASFFIRHEPKAPSGGRASNVNLLEFMAQHRGPQHDALLKLRSRLVAQRRRAAGRVRSPLSSYWWQGR